MDNATKAQAVVITINYKSAVTTLEFVNSLSRAAGFSEVAVAVVDNASGEEELSGIRRAISQLSNVELLESATNRGYFGAARFAFGRLGVEAILQDVEIEGAQVHDAIVVDGVIDAVEFVDGIPVAAFGEEFGGAIEHPAVNFLELVVRKGVT